MADQPYEGPYHCVLCGEPLPPEFSRSYEEDVVFLGLACEDDHLDTPDWWNEGSTAAHAACGRQLSQRHDARYLILRLLYEMGQRETTLLPDAQYTYRVKLRIEEVKPKRNLLAWVGRVRWPRWSLALGRLLEGWASWLLGVAVWMLLWFWPINQYTTWATTHYTDDLISGVMFFGMVVLWFVVAYAISELIAWGARALVRQVALAYQAGQPTGQPQPASTHPTQGEQVMRLPDETFPMVVLRPAAQQMIQAMREGRLSVEHEPATSVTVVEDTPDSTTVEVISAHYQQRITFHHTDTALQVARAAGAMRDPDEWEEDEDEEDECPRCGAMRPVVDGVIDCDCDQVKDQATTTTDQPSTEQ